MIKIVALLKRKPGLTPEEFRSYYADRHAALCWSLAPDEVTDRIVHYVQNHSRQLGRGEAPYDCVTEIGFADEKGLRLWNEWYLGPGGEEIRADEEKFMDVAARVVVIAEELRPDQPSGALSS